MGEWFRWISVNTRGKRELAFNVPAQKHVINHSNYEANVWSLDIAMIVLNDNTWNQIRALPICEHLYKYLNVVGFGWTNRDFESYQTQLQESPLVETNSHSGELLFRCLIQIIRYGPTLHPPPPPHKSLNMEIQVRCHRKDFFPWFLFFFEMVFTVYLSALIINFVDLFENPPPQENLDPPLIAW